MILEKYTFNLIDRDTSPEAISSDGQRKHTPGRAFLIQNGRLLAVESGKIGTVESVRGNEEIVNGLLPTAGTNKEVGCYEDIQTNTLIFFIYNSNGYHTIYKYAPSDGTFTKILQWSGLAFSGSHIKSIGKVGNNLYWADGNIRYVDLGNLSLYTGTLTEQSISVYLTPPLSVPVIGRTTDATVKINTVQADSFKVSFRYIYKNNGQSRLSIWSRDLEALQAPNELATTKNRILITANLDAAIKPFLKKVQFFIMKNNSGKWYLIKEVDSLSGLPLNSGVPYIQFNYDNNYQGFQLPSSEATSDEPIPVSSSVLTLFKDRLFLTNQTVGRSVDETSLTMSLIKYIHTGETFFKEGGSYGVGYKLIDKSGRNTLAKKGGEVIIGSNPAQLSPASPYIYGIDSAADREYYKAKLTGTLPSWAKYFQFVITRETRYSTYVQVPGFILFYQYDKVDLPEGASIPGTNITDKTDRVYLKDKPSGQKETGILHILIPDTMPVVPTTDMYVKVKTATFTKVEKIAGYYGDRISVRGNFGIEDWTSVSCFQFIEIFALAEQKEEILYELPGLYTSSDLNKEIILSADTHLLEVKYYIDRQVEDTQGSSNLFNLGYKNDFPQSTASNSGNTYYVESPTTKTIRTGEAKSVVNPTGSGSGFSFYQKGVDPILDYSNPTNSYGRATVEQKDNGVAYQPNKISFSNTYIQDTSINGLHNFDTDNRKSLPNELSPIVALIPVGGNTMLAIHERETSSISVGDGFFKAGDTNFITVRTEGVIGDERQLQGSMGSLFPGSVVSHEGSVFYFDIYKGCVARYTVAGLFPVSSYGMEAYFKEVAAKYLPYKSVVNIVAGIDNYNSEYIITFPPIEELPGETWAFNYKNNIWTSKYDFIPEGYGKVGNLLYSFKNGRLYEHNKTSVYNNFYGEQYERKIIFFANHQVTKNKRLINVHLLTDRLPEDGEFKVMTVRTASGQESYLRVKHFELKEGTYYAPVLKDINTTVDAGKIPLLSGKDMRDKVFEIELNTDRTDKNYLQEISLVFVESEYSR